MPMTSDLRMRTDKPHIYWDAGYWRIKSLDCLGLRWKCLSEEHRQQRRLAQDSVNDANTVRHRSHRDRLIGNYFDDVRARLNNPPQFVRTCA